MLLKEVRDLYKKALSMHLPRSTLLHFAYADFEEVGVGEGLGEGLDGVEMEGQEDGVVVLVRVSSVSLLKELDAVGLVGGVCVLFAVSRSEGCRSGGLRGTTTARGHGPYTGQ